MTRNQILTRRRAASRATTALAACLVGASLLAGCAIAIDDTHDALTPGEDSSSNDMDVSDGVGTPSTTTPFPRITSCDQVAGALASFVSGMTLVGESIADDGVLCQWAAPDEGPFASLTVAAADDVPTRDALEMQGTMLHLTPTRIDDPRLDGVRGLGVRWTTDGAPDSPGYSNVYVPGVSIELHDGRRGGSGAESYAPSDDTTVSVALAVLGL